MIKLKNTVQNVTEKELCLSCGFCESICPQSSIMMFFNKSKGYHEPVVDINKCEDCGSCIAVCPGLKVDFVELKKIYQREDYKYHNAGSVKDTMIIYSSDMEIRKSAASGGFITQLILYLFDKKKINGAIVCKASRENAFEPYSYIARNKDELTASQMSIYNSVPIGVIAKELLREKGKFIFVGIPCQVHGLLKFIQQVPELKDKIYAIIGNFCGGYQTHFAHQYYFPRKGIEFDDIKYIDYRYGDFPGSFNIGLKNGGTRQLVRRFPDKKSANEINTAFNSMFYIPRCYLCADKGNILADIAAGDPWMPKCKGEKTGKSIAIARTALGKLLIDDAVTAGYLTKEYATYDDINSAQKFDKERHGNQKAYEKVHRIFNRPYPVYSYYGKTKIYNRKIYLRVLMDFIKPWLQRKKKLWFLLRPFYFFEKHFRNIFIYKNPFSYFKLKLLKR